MIPYLLFFLIFQSVSISYAQTVNHSDPYDITYEKNIILLKIKDNVVLPKVLGKSAGVVTTGIVSLDDIFLKYKIEKMEKIFKNEKAPLQKRMFKDYYGKEHEVGRLDKIYKLAKKMVLLK